MATFFLGSSPTVLLSTVFARLVLQQAADVVAAPVSPDHPALHRGQGPLIQPRALERLVQTLLSRRAAVPQLRQIVTHEFCSDVASLMGASCILHI